jgi:hypothetical protein
VKIEWVSCPACTEVVRADMDEGGETGVLEEHNRPKPWTPQASPDVRCQASLRRVGVI